VKAPVWRKLRGLGTIAKRNSPKASLALEQALKKFVKQPSGAITLAKMPEHVTQCLGTDVPEVQLSAETLAKQQRHHPELTMQDYISAAELVSNPTVVLAGGSNHVLLLRRGGHVLVGVVKATLARDENFLVSLRIANGKGLARLLRNHSILCGDPDDLTE
jgi:hypothetical protein